MPHPRYSNEAICERGRARYAELREIVETEENIGKIISIDIETGEYAIDKDHLKSGMPLLKRRPEAALWGERIGYDAVYGIGATVKRTVRV